MKKYSVLVLFVFLVLCTFKISAEDENPVFKSLKCNFCHKADTGRAYPSLKEIAMAYDGDSKKLEQYLQGKAEPIVNKEKSKTMERYIEKTKVLSEDEMKSLVDYILSCKDVVTHQ